MLGNVEELIKIAEEKVTEQKHKNRDKNIFIKQVNTSGNFIDLSIPANVSEQQKQAWKTLNEKINILIDSHLRDIRPSNVRFQYESDHIKRDLKSFGKAFLDLFYNFYKEQGNESKIDSNTKHNDKNTDAHSEMDSCLTPESASIIHKLFTNKNVNLNDLSTEELNNVKESLDNLDMNLIRNQHSGLLGKSYYKLFLADKLLKSKQNYQAVYFSISGIRPSNTAYGHNITDNKIEKTSKLLVNAFSKKRMFNNEPFSFSKNDIFLIDQGGGNFISLLTMKKALKPEEIEDIVNEVNSQCTEDIDSSFKIASAAKNHVNKRTIPLYTNSMAGNPSNLVEWFRTMKLVIKNHKKHHTLLAESNMPSNMYNEKPFVQLSKRLKEDCNNNKDALKVDNLDKAICENSIKSIAKDCVSYYYSEIENPCQLANRKLFLDNVILALANHEAYVNSLNQGILKKKLAERLIFRKQNGFIEEER